MKSKVYNENQLWNVHTNETKTWVGKHTIVNHKDGNTIKGIIKELQYTRNSDESDGVVEYLWVDLLIEKRIPITEIKILEINQ